MDDLFDNQDLLEFVIFALILLTLMCDSRVILKEKLEANHP